MENLNQDKPYVVKVDDVQVFSADFVFTQMGAQSCRIDRLWNIAIFASVVSVISVLLIFLLWKLG